jgi:hypothetical protein
VYMFHDGIGGGGALTAARANRDHWQINWLGVSAAVGTHPPASPPGTKHVTAPAGTCLPTLLPKVKGGHWTLPPTSNAYYKPGGMAHLVCQVGGTMHPPSALVVCSGGKWYGTGTTAKCSGGHKEAVHTGCAIAKCQNCLWKGKCLKGTSEQACLGHKGTWCSQNTASTGTGVPCIALSNTCGNGKCVNGKCVGGG